MDFIIFYGLIGISLLQLIFSYDIACQWHRNLSTRNKQFPPSMQLSKSLLAAAVFLIPKFHIYAHGPSCQSTFSFNTNKHVGRTDAEEPERWWSHINPVSMQTREMTPGARQDTIEDHTQSYNYRKITNFGKFQLYNMPIMT